MKTRMKYPFGLVLIALGLAGLACQSSVLGVPVAIASPTLTAPAVLPQVASAAAPSPALDALPGGDVAVRAGEICFDGIAGGSLRVRECPGLDCREAGILAGGDRIAVTGERKDVDGTTWLRITKPLDGWISARYACEIGGGR